MTWNQIVDPLGNIYLSLLIALVPIATIFWALAIKKMKGHKASLYAALAALLVAVLIYGMPIKLALLSFTHGALYGLFPICWIVVTTIYLFNIIVKSGKFEIIKHSMASITSDRRLQALLIAFAFGSFLEGTAGFGAPVAITAAMLVSLGFNAFYAAGICLIANTAPVAFGAIGIPITVASQVSGIPEMAISQLVGRTLPILSVVLPFYLTMLICGYKKSLEVFPAILVCGISFASLQWFSSNFLGPELPDIIAGLGSIICLIIFLKFWKPKNIWRFENEEAPSEVEKMAYTKKQIAIAWFPFVILAVLIIVWGLAPVKEKLDLIGTFKFDIKGLHNVILDRQGEPIPHGYKLNMLSAAGTAILITALLSIPISGMKYREGFALFFSTLKQLKFPIITVSAILGFAYVVNDSGIVITIALVLANTGFLYPFVAPILGWLGVFVTGSDTSSNALFGKLQFETAKSIGVDPLVTVASNTSGGVVGKMISPQSIAVGTAAVGLIGKEAQLFRYTLKHSLIMLLLICLITLAQAYIIPWIVPIWN